jgi:NAD(P)H-hydrate epimerase
MDRADYAAAIPEPAFDANKYSRGTLLIVAGSADYPGAAILAAMAAARTGAGFVTLATAKPAVATAQNHLLTVRIVGLAATARGSISTEAHAVIHEHQADNDALLIGPGLTRDETTASVVRTIVTESTVPTVIDADGLNAFTGHLTELESATQPLILTPHAGELARLTTVDALARPGRVVVAKGPTTTITDSTRMIVDDTGPSSLATPGTGDVLAGIIGALVCQGVDPFMAAATGVRVHAMAAQCAIEDTTACCMLATDVIEHIACAVARLKGSDTDA